VTQHIIKFSLTQSGALKVAASKLNISKTTLADEPLPISYLPLGYINPDTATLRKPLRDMDEV
jgi:hypothetical protein